MPSKNAIKAINYIRNDRGELVPVFPMSTADNIYTDINKKITVQDAIVGGKVESGVYVYHNVYSSGIAGNTSGVMKLELPMGADNIDVDMNVIVSGMTNELNDDVIQRNFSGSFTRNTVSTTVNTTVAEDNYTGSFAFIAVYNESGINEYALFNLSNNRVVKRDDITNLPSRPLQAKFDESDKYLVILCESHICVYIKTSTKFYLASINSRNLETETSTMTVDNIGLIYDGVTTYLVALSENETTNIEFYSIDSDGILTRSTDYIVNGGYYANGIIYTKDMNIFIRYAAGTMNDRPLYCVDRLYIANANTNAYVSEINIFPNKVCSFNLIKSSNLLTIYRDQISTDESLQNLIFVYIVGFERHGAFTVVDGYASTNSTVVANGFFPTIENFSGTYGNIIGYGISNDENYNGLYLDVIEEGSPDTSYSIYNSRLNNITITDEFIHAFMHPSNGYMYLITASNMFGLPIVPVNTKIYMDKSNIELSDAPGAPFPSNTATTLDVSCDGKCISYIDSNAQTLSVYRRISNTDPFNVVSMINAETTTYEDLNDIAFVNNDYLCVIHSFATSVNTIKGLRLYSTGNDDELVGTQLTYHTLLDIDGSMVKIFASKKYEDNSPYGIIVVGPKICVIDFSNPSSPVISTMETEIPNNFAEDVDIASRINLTNVLFCRDTFTSGFYHITPARIIRYKMAISDNGAISVVEDYRISATDYNIITSIPSSSVLWEDNSTIIMKYTDGNRIKMFNWSGDGADTVVSEIDPEIVGIDNFDGGVNYKFDKFNNELMMIISGSIGRFSVTNTSIIYKGSYLNIPEISDSNIFEICDSGNVLFGTTALGNNIVSSGEYDFGMILIETGKQPAVTNIRATGNLTHTGWSNYNITTSGITKSDNVRLGYDNITGKACLLVGDTDTQWSNLRVQISYISYSGIGNKYPMTFNTNYYANNYNINVIGSISNIIHLTTSADRDGLNYAKRIKTNIISIMPDMWSNDTTGIYVYRYYNGAIKSSSTVNVNISDVQSLNIANISNLHSISVEKSGYVEIYSSNIPTGIINVSFEILN